MSATATRSRIETPTQTTEEVVKKWFTEDELSNQVINAFEEGMRHMKEQERKRFDTALEKAKKVSEIFYLSLNTSLDVKCKEIRLRPISAKGFEAIFIIPQKDFLDKQKYQQAYELGLRIRQENNTDKFYVSFLFMPASKRVDNIALLADGFAWTFGLLSNSANEPKARARKA